MLSLSGIETGYRFSKALLCIYKRLRICSFQKIQILQNSSNTNKPGKKEDELFYAQKCGNIPWTPIFEIYFLAFQVTCYFRETGALFFCMRTGTFSSTHSQGLWFHCNYLCTTFSIDIDITWWGSIQSLKLSYSDSHPLCIHCWRSKRT